MKFCFFFFLCVPFLIHAEEFSFDVSSYEKKSYEWSGYLEGSGEYLNLNPNTAFYNLNFSNTDKPTSFNRYLAALQLEGLYRFQHNSISSSINFRGLADIQDDYFGREQALNSQEFYYAVTPNDQFTGEIGKRVMKWGKGYAWNPVGFIERPKDPNDPELTREGFIIANVDYVQSFNGSLKTLSITPVLLPVSNNINSDFSEKNNINVAVKITLLYRDTDIDLLFLSKASRSGRMGIDFSRNINPSFELHGEFSFIDSQSVTIINEQNQLSTQQENTYQSLLGIRFVTQSDVTWIAEYYHNSAGYNKAELQRFFSLAKENPQTSPALFELAKMARQAGYGAPNVGRNYLYLRASKKDIFDVVYLSSGLTSIVNINDQSFSVIPELIYTGISNSELRFRLLWIAGDKNTDFYEKQNNFKMEARFRYYF